MHHDTEHQILETLREINRGVHQLLKLAHHRAQSATLTLNGDSMPLIVHINDLPGTAVFQEFDGPAGTGNKLPPIGAVIFASDNPAVATVDPSSGQLAYLAEGAATISASDAGNSLNASDVLTVSLTPPPPAQSATLTLVPGASVKTA